jgi:hypothetical protein
MNEYYIMIWIIVSFLTAMIGEKKAFGYWGTLLLCLLLSPVLGGIIAYLSKDKEVIDLEKKALTKAAGDDVVSQLEKLSQLKDKGAITSEEYDAFKARLL